MGRALAVRLAWPGLACASFALTSALLARGVEGTLVITAVYVSLAVAVASLERWLPHAPRWNRDDGEIAHDIVFTLLGSGVTAVVVQALLVAALTSAAGRLSALAGSPLWPTAWPLALQVGLTVLVADLGAYWAHRICHEWRWLWPFHAVHHSVRRLWWLNTGRIHPVDVATSFVLSTPALILLGAPESMMVWLACATSVIGMLSHCNIEMRTGWLDRIFNTPAVHRWHHSRDRSEADANYGENTTIWDQLFASFFLPARAPSIEIGTATPVPNSIAGQMLQPLLGNARWEALRRARFAGARRT